MARNFSTVLLLLMTLIPKTSWAQTEAARGGLREGDVIRLARARAPGSLVAEATEVLAGSNEGAAGLPPNPELLWARESVNTGPRSNRGSQDLIGVNVPLDIARTSADRSLASAQSSWMRAEASLVRTDAVLDSVLTYYEVAFADQRVQVLASALQNLEEAARVLERRQTAGTVSGYERSRLSVESELGKSRLVEARTAWEREKIQLATMLGQASDSIHIDADLSLLSVSREKTLATANGKEREALRRAESARLTAAEAKSAAGWTWFPRLEIGGGLKRANGLGSDQGLGYFVGANVGLPIFDRGQGRKARADAEQKLISARSEALARRIAADIQSSLIVFRRARGELERFENATSDHVEQLLRAAQSGYREGERTIVELLDAQRARTDVALRRLHLLAAAKEAEVRLRSAAGELK